MKFGLMYEIQIPEPHYDGIEQERGAVEMPCVSVRAPNALQ